MTETDLLVIVPHEDDACYCGSNDLWSGTAENEYKSCVCHERRLLQT